MMRQFNKTITLVVGEPIKYTLFDHSRTELQWSAMIKEKVYSLKNEFN
jgi:hypothetical protein